MEKKIYQIFFCVNVMVIQNNVLKMILGWNIPFVYPNLEWTLKSIFSQLINFPKCSILFIDLFYR
jgi:hypothetical protein